MTAAGVAELAAAARLRPPRALTVAITGSCNLRCRHCWVEAGTATSAGHAPADRLLRLVDDLADLGGEAIWLSGGEPLHHPDWAALLAHCCSRAPLRTVGIQTNGALLDARAVARLSRLPLEKLHIQVSVDGSSPWTHDRVRGRGSFEAAMAGVARLAAAGLAGRTSFAFTEMRHNMADVPALLELAERLGVGEVVGGTLVKGGYATRSALASPTPEQYRRLLWLYHCDPQFRGLYERHGRFPAVEWWKGRTGNRGDPCRFIDHPYVSARGALHPCRLCHADEFAVAGAFERPLAEALRDGIARWRELAELARSRSEALAECRECRARVQCAGGCMGRAHAACGSLAAVEDRCELRKAVALWRAVGEREGS